MDLYDADDAFLDLAVSFGDKPRSSDAGHGAMNVKQKENGAYGRVARISARHAY